MECEHMAEQLHPEDIYQTLEYEIVTLKIKPGETISENQLCKRFGISRTPVRAALQRLEQNGFVQIIPCKGTIVTPIDLDIVDQIVYQRTAVESMVRARTCCGWLSRLFSSASPRCQCAAACH